MVFIKVSLKKMIDTIKNIWLIIISFLGSIWLIYLYLRVISAEREINLINKRLEEIEKYKYELKKDLEFSYPNEPEVLNNMDYQEIEEMNFDYSIEQDKLERQKKYVLEKIELFKIFKK